MTGDIEDTKINGHSGNPRPTKALAVAEIEEKIKEIIQRLTGESEHPVTISSFKFDASDGGKNKISFTTTIGSSPYSSGW